VYSTIEKPKKSCRIARGFVKEYKKIIYVVEEKAGYFLLNKQIRM
jgi:hypothetical protein